MAGFGVNAAGTSDPGKLREMNQDCFLANRVLNLYAVADGIESAPHGERASRMAVEELEKLIKELDLSEDATPPFEDNPALPLPARGLKYALREVNRRIYQYGRENKKYKGMGTTLTAAWFVQGKVFIGHIGDSRAYLIRKGMAQQLTSDHTALSEKRPEGMELYEGLTHTSEHALSRAVGINQDVQVQLAGGTPALGDRFVLCTDGLYGQVRDFEIAKTAVDNPPHLACMKLAQMANQRGGSDNLAVVVIQIE